MPLLPGEAAPDLHLTDINGDSFGSLDYPGTIRIFTFADRNSSGRLMAWLSDANIQIKTAQPSAKLTYINFADVSIVPKLMRKVVRPVLRTINSHSLQQLERVYDEAGISEGREDIVFHLIPDWSGEYLRHFGIRDACNYCMWIEQHGAIVATLHEPMEEPATQFIACISGMVEANTSG